MGSSQALVAAASMQMAAADISTGADRSHTVCSSKPEARSCCVCGSFNIGNTSSSSNSAYRAEVSSRIAWCARARGCYKQFAGLQGGAQPGSYPVLCVDCAGWQQQAVSAAEHSNLATVHCSRVAGSSSWLGHHTTGGETPGLHIIRLDREACDHPCLFCADVTLHLHPQHSALQLRLPQAAVLLLCQ